MWGASGGHLTGLAHPCPLASSFLSFSTKFRWLFLSWLLAPYPHLFSGASVTSLAARLSSPPSLPELIIREAHLRVLFHSSPQRLLWERGHFTSYLLPFTSLR